MSRKQDNYSSISDFIGTEMNGSIVVDAKQRTISDHGNYIRVRQDFTLENGGWSWKEVFQEKPNNMSARNMAEETKDKDDEADQEGPRAGGEQRVEVRRHRGGYPAAERVGPQAHARAHLDIKSFV